MIFLYFVPGESPDTFRKSAAFNSGGLSLVFGDCVDSLSFTETKGPSGTAGVIVAAMPADQEKPFPIRYQPDRQEWWQCGEYWIGANTAFPPTPEGIERRKVLDHYRYTLADGREWKCPRVRRGVIPLVPHWYRIENREFRFEVKPEFTDIWEQSFDWTTDGSISVGDIVSAASLCLSLNYRGTAEEFSYMKAFDPSSLMDIMKAALDEEFYLELVAMNQKKNS